MASKTESTLKNMDICTYNDHMPKSAIVTFVKKTIYFIFIYSFNTGN